MDIINEQSVPKNSEIAFNFFKATNESVKSKVVQSMNQSKFFRLRYLCIKRTKGYYTINIQDNENNINEENRFDLPNLTL